MDGIERKDHHFVNYANFAKHLRSFQRIGVIR